MRRSTKVNEGRHVTFEGAGITSGVSNTMEKKSKTRQSKQQGAERKRNTDISKGQSKKLKNNEVVTKVQEGRQEATTAEELIRTTERNIKEIKQSTVIQFKDLGMLVSQVPRVEERKHMLRTEWAEIEKKSALIKESKELDQFEGAIEHHEQLVSRVEMGLDSISSQFDLLEDSTDVNDLMPLLSHLLLACNID